MLAGTSRGPLFFLEAAITGERLMTLDYEEIYEMQ
jgi:hypothetical protein